MRILVFIVLILTQISAYAGKCNVEKFGDALTDATADAFVKATNPFATCNFGDFLAGLNSGDSNWIGMYPKIRSHTDAGTSESADIALAYGIKHSAQKVLNAILEAHQDESICVKEVPETPTKSLVSEYTLRHEALGKIEENSELLTKCRDAVNKILAHFKPQKKNISHAK